MVFRRNYLKENQIAIIPKNGYRLSNQQSLACIQWILYEEKQRNIVIKNAATGKEHKVCGFKVDGFCEETKEIFEFHGCFYHGCTKCFLHGRDEPLYDDKSTTMNLRYSSTVEKTAHLRSQGYTVNEKWECEFKNLLSAEERQEIKKNPLLNKIALNPRDSFYGGRTGNTTMYYKTKEGEQIKYVDVCSLYPFICKYGKFPVGHPTIIIGHEECIKEDLTKINGLIKCSILPPSDLFHPVLPLKQNNKLMFALCRTCGEKMYQGECTHTVEERSMTNTWVIDEVVKALEKGYKIMEIHEIWRYNVEEYDHESKSGGLFTEMMNKFIKMKQEASGWPSSCNTTEEKNEYIKHYMHNEGVQLDFNCIDKNSGLRSVAKLMLNSFWGKFGQKENQSKTEVIKDSVKLYSLLFSPYLEVHNILPINEETIVVTWQYLEEVCINTKTSNVSIASFTTALARLKLYSYLEKLGDRVLYYDTDSVIYVSKEGLYEPPTGNLIGDMTDELEGEYVVDSYITEFVSGGPKNYAYRVKSTLNSSDNIVCKVKGIRLDYKTSKLINLESMRDLILKNENGSVELVSNNIRRTPYHDVVTKTETKQYRINSTKRKFLEDYSSVPYGFKRLKHS